MHLNDIVLLLLAVLLVYRLSIMIALEDGPAWIFKIIREDILHDFRFPYWVYNGITCPFCNGVYLSAIVSLFLSPDIAHYPLYVFGISGAQTFLLLLAGVPDTEDEVDN